MWPLIMEVVRGQVLDGNGSVVVGYTRTENRLLHVKN
jgi:hypothetical protein